LDTILLSEYDDLDPQFQELYRHVAALEAIGARVHRQLVIRMLGVEAGKISDVLEHLSGIIDEYDIRPKDGIFGWRTRHLVIARRIAEYKFSGLDELTDLFRKIISSINPSQPIELQSIRNICDAEFGIGRLGDADTRLSLYRALIERAPAERIPWHRLLRELLDDFRFDDMEYELRNAEEAVGSDSPLDRFKVRLLLARAIHAKKISDGDRLAILRRAYELAMVNIERHSADKYTYYTLCDVAVELVDRGESEHLLRTAIEKLRLAADEILDPAMTGPIERYERRLHRGR
jgi:hypothetical protein